MLEPGSQEALFQLGIITGEDGQPRAAVALLDKHRKSASSEAARSHWPEFYRARFLLEDQRPAECLAALEPLESMLLSPGYWRLRLDALNALGRNKQATQARARLRKLLEQQ